MNFPTSYPIREIASWINATIIGDDGLIIKGINEIHKVEPGDITFVDIPKYFTASFQSSASAIIVPSPTDCPPGKVLLVVEKPFLAYEAIVNRFRPFEALRTEDRENYEIHETAIIEPGAIIGQNVRIGKHCIIHAGAIIRPYSYLGDRVVIQSGAIIGTEAFYFKRWPDKLQRWTGCGRVIIEDDVWIGSCCTIAAGVSGDTIIGEGTKIDCQVMVGHGAVIGKHCLIIAQVAIAGKVHIGDWCVIYGQSGVTQNLNVGDRTTIYAQSLATKDLEGDAGYFGNPAVDVRKKYREMTALKKMAADYLSRREENS